MKDKYVWWGVLGIGVAAFFWFLTKQQISSSVNGPNGGTIPVFVPQPLQQTTDPSSPSTGNSVSEQPSIVGSHPNSSVPNGNNMTWIHGGTWDPSGQPNIPVPGVTTQTSQATGQVMFATSGNMVSQ